MADDGGPSRSEPRYPCRVCGRNFFSDSLAKHENVCAKNASKKRKVFDSSKQRAEGTDMTHRQIKQAQKKEVPAPRSNWRAKHEDFINTVRAARGVSKAMAEGGPLPPPPPPSINPDYVQCPYCSRRFNQQAAERHINFCKEQSQRINNRPPPNAAAKAKQATRLQYQPPRPKVKATAPASGSPSNSSSASRLPGPTSRAPPGGTGAAGGRSGMGGPAARGRAGSYQAQGVAGARPPAQNYSRNAATSAPDHDSFLRSTTTITTSGTASTTTKNTTSHQRKPIRNFSHNPHRKLSGIGDHSFIDGNVGYEKSPSPDMTPRSARRDPRVHSGKRDSALTSGRREPAFAEDFCSSGDQSPESNFTDHEEYSYRSPPDFPSKPLLYHKNGTGSAKSRHRGAVTSVADPARLSKFCHECGSRYPIPTAKFCCECGTRRVAIS